MLFNSIPFLLFFPIVLLLYFAVPFKHRWIVLLVASYYFYMCWNPQYALLMLFSTFSTWIAGYFLGRFQAKEQTCPKCVIWKKVCVAASFICNLAILAFFKYGTFLSENLTALLGLLHISVQVPVFDVLLPVGISFYTFQALSYTVDVYRGEVPPEKNFFRYALFVSFFPQLVAGPIERTGNLLRQVNQGTRFSFASFRRGLMLMLWGYFVKMVIADNAAVVVDAIFNHYRMYAGFTLIFATILFAIQIYCDFSGYSLIAIGAAEVLGFSLCQNFRQPYLATSVADFWHRWHISLSTWFRDYLYIPLGGNRKSLSRKYLNLMITFLVSGLWHGAAWTYVVWGGINGLMQVLGDMRRRVGKSLRERFDFLPVPREPVFSARLLQRLITFVLICVTWVFFRASSLSAALEIIKRFFVFNPWIFFDGSLLKLGFNRGQYIILALSVGMLFAVDILHECGYHIRDTIVRQQLWFRWLLYLLGIMAVMLFGVYGLNMSQGAFIYFQF